MKKGGRFVGVVSGLCLEIRDKTAKGFQVECERRIVDKKSGEITIEKRLRDVSAADMPRVLKGYRKA